MKSIIHDEKQCFVCGTTLNLHCHHIFGGTANRKLSEKYGLKVFLCGYHHNLSNDGVHFNKPLDIHLKKLAQEKFEALYGANTNFREVFGKNFID